MKQFIIFMVVLLLNFSAYSQDIEENYELSEEEIELLLEEGFSQEEIDDYILNGLSSEEREVISSVVESFREERNEEELLALLEGFENLGLNDIGELSEDELQEILSRAQDLLEELDLGEIGMLDLDATRTKEAFLEYIKSNSRFLVDNPEIFVIISLVVDLVNNDLNIKETIRRNLLPTIGVNGDILKTYYDRELNFDILIFETGLGPLRLEKLTDSFEKAIDKNFKGELGEIIKQRF